MSALDSLRIEDLNEEWQQIADVIGIDNVRKLFREFPGASIYFPKMEDLERSSRNQRIREEFNGYNFRPLANKYGLSERSVRYIVADRVKKIRSCPLDGQLSCFENKY